MWFTHPDHISHTKKTRKRFHHHPNNRMAGHQDPFEHAMNQIMVEDCLTPEEAGEMLEMRVVENATAKKPAKVMKTPVKKSKREKRGEYRPPAARLEVLGESEGQSTDDEEEEEEDVESRGV